MAKNHSAAWPFFVLGIGLFSGLVFFLGRHLIGREFEYRKDQALLAELVEPKLPKEPLPEVKYPIKGYRIPGIGGFCWLESSSGLINYLEPDIDFDSFVFYGRPTLFMAGRNGKERWGPGLNQIYAFKALGYTAFVGSTQVVPPFPLEKVMPAVDPRNLIYFKSAGEELEFIKRLVSAKIIPTVTYQGDFSTVTGYNSEGFWLVVSAFGVRQVDEAIEGSNFMTPPVAYKASLVSYDDFLKGWSRSHQMIWFEKTGQRKPESEVYLENKENAQEAPGNIRETIVYLKNGGSLIDFTFEIDVPSTMALYRYFSKRGNLDLADKYLEIAKIYDAQRASVGPNAQGRYSRDFIIETLTKVRPLYEEAAKMWP